MSQRQSRWPSYLSPKILSPFFSALLSVLAKLTWWGSSGSQALSLPMGFGKLEDQQKVWERKRSEVRVIIAGSLPRGVWLRASGCPSHPAHSPSGLGWVRSPRCYQLLGATRFLATLLSPFAKCYSNHPVRVCGLFPAETLTDLYPFETNKKIVSIPRGEEKLLDF